MCVREKITIGGSGSGFIYGFVDSGYKENMSKEECIKFVSKGKSSNLFDPRSSVYCFQ